MERPFVCHIPQNNPKPIIYSSPHSGRIYETSFLMQAALSFKEIRMSEDFYVDQLFATVIETGSFFLEACFPRSFVDVNRSSDDLDHKLIAKSDTYRMSPRTAAGLGVIPRIVSDGIDIYDKKLSAEEVKWRLNNFYFPYHSKLRQLIDQAIENFGFAILLDVHSMPHNCLDHLADDKLGIPQIILGDCFGSSSTSNFSQQVYDIFTSEGFNVRRNSPFSGGFITKNYGLPRQNVQAIQIEIDRSLYMDEQNLILHSGFLNLRRKLQNIIYAISTIGLCESYFFQAAE